MKKKGIRILDSKVLIMGLTFKENCPDIRNSKVIDLVEELKRHKVKVDVYDPWITDKDKQKLSNINLIQELRDSSYDGIVLATPHEIFNQLSDSDIKSLMKHESSVFFDIKSVRNKNMSDFRL